MDNNEAKEKALSFWEKVKAAYKSNPLAEVRKGEITCPKCHAANIEVAVSCKECGEKFEYKSAKPGVILGIGLAASILLVIATWMLCAATAVASAFGDETADAANGVYNLLWLAAVAGIVATVASYKMKHWGWKLQSIVVGIYVLAGLSEGLGSAFGMFLMVSPLAISSWLGYRVLIEAGQFLDAIHGQAPTK